MSSSETRNGTHPTTVRVAALWAKGLSVAQIAERMGMSDGGVRNALQRAGVSLLEDGKYRMTNPVWRSRTGQPFDYGSQKGVEAMQANRVRKSAIKGRRKPSLLDVKTGD